jgi:NAD(P)H-dependent FMN reductase
MGDCNPIPNPQQDGLRSIAVVTCSTRPSRIGHLIAQHVASQLSSSLSSNGDDGLSITSVDLESHPLPLFDEPGIPAHFPAADPTPHYAHPHARAWSAEVLKHSAFVFVTPEYNSGYPAAIKNAMDYLFYEWNGKPALVVSYGSRGGTKSAEQLIQVCKGLRMKPVEKSVGYTIIVNEVGTVREDGEFDTKRMEAWKTEGSDANLETRFRELLALLQKTDRRILRLIDG